MATKPNRANGQERSEKKPERASRPRRTRVVSDRTADAAIRRITREHRDLVKDLAK